MAISINWATKVIYVPQSYLTDLGSGRYELDLDQFRLDLKDIEDSVDGMAFLDTHRHNTEVVLSGVIYARVFEIINGYTVEFENGTYTVICTGANHNLADVKVVNSVSLIVGNAAGLITVISGSGLSEDQSQALGRIDTTVQQSSQALTDMGGEVQEMGVKLQFVEGIDAGRWKIVNNQMIFYEADNVTEICRFDLLDADGKPTMQNVFERRRVA